MNKTQLDAYKASYLQIKASEKQIDESWENVKHRLPKQDIWSNYMVMRYAFASIALLSIFFVGFVNVVQAAKPGEILYPVKVLQNNVLATILKKAETVPDDIKESLSSPDTIKNLPTEKKKTPEETSNDEKQEQKNNTSLKEQNKEEKKDTTPQLEELLNKNNQQTQKTEEVKGATTDEEKEGKTQESTEKPKSTEKEKKDQPSKPSNENNTHAPEQKGKK